MNLSILKIEEFIIWLLTYLFSIIGFSVFVAFFGNDVKIFFNNRSKINVMSSNDIKHVEDTYGKVNPTYEYINNILDFVNSYIPGNMLIIIFFLMLYILYFFTVKFIQYRKPPRNSYIVYFSNALNSLASSLSSLIFFITSFLFLILIFISNIGLFGGYSFWLLLGFLVIYLFFSLIFFLFDRSLGEAIKKSIS